MFEQLALFRLQPEAPQPRERHVHLGAQIVGYTLNQGRHRRMSLTIDERGLRVGAPRQTKLAEIDEFIRSHAVWVLEKLEEFAATRAPRQVSIRAGVKIPFLDGEITIEVLPGSNRVRWLGDTLILEARADTALDALARRGLQKRALSLFAERLNHYAALMRRAPPQLALTSARTRWGSCSQSSGIRLNWRLIHLPLHLIDYVVAHEMAHLIEMNHSAKFWAQVGKLYPDWEAARDELKVRTTSIPII
ncbi:MAG TPA: SprT family zinc-dependent metalloprotease [Rhodocyclaceae bacterium]|jgi:predicted metal-dependent hydrolase|nr:SprT family zinc-dependent metalloprotease [Rhodocyclaceae bacterium]